MGHLQEVGESYIQHLKVTVKVATRFACAVGSQLIHGLVPDLRPPFHNDIESLIDFLYRYKPEVRRAENIGDDDLYTNYGGD